MCSAEQNLTAAVVGVGNSLRLGHDENQVENQQGLAIAALTNSLFACQIPLFIAGRYSSIRHYFVGDCIVL